MITIEPNSRQPNVKLSSLNVPRPNGTDFLAPRLAAIAIGATMGIKRLAIITSALTISNCRAVGAGFGLLLKPYVTPRPSNADPLLAEAEENWYRISEKP